jgi:hypothetical protein
MRRHRFGKKGLACLSRNMCRPKMKGKLVNVLALVCCWIYALRCAAEQGAPPPWVASEVPPVQKRICSFNAIKCDCTVIIYRLDPVPEVGGPPPFVLLDAYITGRIVSPNFRSRLGPHWFLFVQFERLCAGGCHA